MADANKGPEFSPEDLRKTMSNFDPQAIAEEANAAAGGVSGQPGAGGQPTPSPAEVANQAALQQKARPDQMPDRDERLVHVGRGQETAGRLGDYRKES